MIKLQQGQQLPLEVQAIFGKRQRANFKNLSERVLLPFEAIGCRKHCFNRNVVKQQEM